MIETFTDAEIREMQRDAVEVNGDPLPELKPINFDVYGFDKISAAVEAEAKDPLAYAFPTVDPGLYPLGNRILVQIRRPKPKSKGGIILASETKDTEKWNTSVAKVIAVGDVAYRSVSTGEQWGEGPWVKPGDYVHIPLYNGLRVVVPAPDGGEPVLFVTFKDIEAIARITCNPLDVVAYIV